MAIAAFLATAFMVGASAAWHLLRGRDNPAIRKMLSMAMWMALIVAPIQAVAERPAVPPLPPGPEPDALSGRKSAR